MDKYRDGDATMTGPEAGPQLAWAPKWATVIAAIIGAAVLGAGSASYSDDIVGRGLLGLAAVLLLIIAAIGGLVRPRLRVVPGPGGAAPRLAVRTPFTSREYRIDQIYRLRVVRYPRLARKVPILEIDVREPDERLLLLSRWDLGTHPDRVYSALVEARAVPPEPHGL